jgi:hypothetical protein
MHNPFQEQLFKAGIATKKQVQQVQQDNKKKHKQQRNKKQPPVDENRLKAQQASAEKTSHDRELNKQKEHAARNKAISAEINQLITQHSIKRGENCEIVYNFEHNKKVKRIYINAAMQQQIMQGKLGIARIEGRYELVPAAIAEKIQRRNEKRVVLFTDKHTDINEDDGYADYKIPDDLMW